jgi:hypothetical protein
VTLLDSGPCPSLMLAIIAACRDVVGTLTEPERPDLNTAPAINTIRVYAIFHDPNRGSEISAWIRRTVRDNADTFGPPPPHKGRATA